MGGFEARAIAMEIERIFTPRPMSHDLMKRIIIGMKGDLFEVQITELKDDVYYAKLVVKMDDGSFIHIDARSSDAVALAVRFGCGIYTNQEVLSRAGMEWEGFVELEAFEEEALEEELEEEPEEPPYSVLDVNELLAELETALDEEDYKKAAIIRDELEKRK